MAQLFDRSADTYLRLALLIVVLAVAGGFFTASKACEPSYITAKGWAPVQPVPFSHDHHVDGLGIDCQYCHGSVETSSSAGYPSTHTCMSCHSQVWTNADALEPVRESYRTGEPIRWRRVYDLPEFVFFKHDIHVAKGVGCEECHGRVDQQPLIRQSVSLKMSWCLDCHRNPAQYVRPRDEIYTMGWKPEGDREQLGRELVEAYGIDTELLTDCSICHY